MKKCKCINSKYFDDLGQDDYGIYFGDIVYYQISDIMDLGGGVIQSLFEIKHKNGTVYVLERDFSKTFIDLYEHRKNIIDKLCN